MSVIAAVGFNSAAIGVHGVQFGYGVFVEGISSLKQNTAIPQYINGKKVSRCMGERQRLFVAGDERGNFQHEFARELVRINRAVMRNIERPHAIVIALCNLAWLAGSSSCDRNF